MEATEARVVSLSHKDLRTYLIATLFILGNIMLPQICHLFPGGGLRFLPIYFFTLVGAYKYGWRVGLLTALLSPAVNSVLFGMPPAAMLPAITVKSAILALAAGYAARRSGKATLLSLAAVIATYQLLGCAAEIAMGTPLAAAIQDITFGFPGLAVQLFGGYCLLKYLLRG